MNMLQVQFAKTRKTVFESEEQLRTELKNMKPYKHWSEDSIEAYIQYGFKKLKPDSPQLTLACPAEWETKNFEPTFPKGTLHYIPTSLTPTIYLYGEKSTLSFILPYIEAAIPEAKAPIITELLPAQNHLFPMDNPPLFASHLWKWMQFMEKFSKRSHL
eukprot:TRINITY_DN1374_c0_g1_i2.p2 TRINITY_DN1374_c0_g1~~TRINITY_DN1374_c0_g1_i2.p2  ORF type:complete len:159 (-),score=41.53 TRINITY_DN1374_c0_g1_i2:32-508(-)